MLSLIASALITTPDYKIQMGKTIPAHDLCRTLLISQKTFTGHDGRISNYAPCTIDLGEGAGTCVIQKGKRTANCWLYNKPATSLPRPRVALNQSDSAFNPWPAGTPPVPPKPPTPVGTGGRVVMFVPLAQMFNPITAIGDFLSRQTQPKPDPMAKYNACIVKGQKQRVDEGKPTDDRAVKRDCMKYFPKPTPKK
jgi:hypothetical protein